MKAEIVKPANLSMFCLVLFFNADVKAKNLSFFSNGRCLNEFPSSRGKCFDQGGVQHGERSEGGVESRNILLVPRHEDVHEFTFILRFDELEDVASVGDRAREAFESRTKASGVDLREARGFRFFHLFNRVVDDFFLDRFGIHSGVVLMLCVV